eukprot:91238-Amphidinium_carterae.1
MRPTDVLVKFLGLRWSRLSPLYPSSASAHGNLSPSGSEGCQLRCTTHSYLSVVQHHHLSLLSAFDVDSTFLCATSHRNEAMLPASLA